jgi:hypothetical protein
VRQFDLDLIRHWSVLDLRLLNVRPWMWNNGGLMMMYGRQDGVMIDCYGFA